jgi:hypothetical protein
MLTILLQCIGRRECEGQSRALERLERELGEWIRMRGRREDVVRGRLLPYIRISRSAQFEWWDCCSCSRVSHLEKKSEIVTVKREKMEVLDGMMRSLRSS